MRAAAGLQPTGTLRPATYRTLFGLLAATGLRISEALALRLGDILDDSLVVQETKFRKSRLLPLHDTTCQALDTYVRTRMSVAGADDRLFLSNAGTPPAYSTVVTVFLSLARAIGLRGAPGEPGPCIHDLRHSFAVRSLQACGPDRHAVARHVVGLSTNLGHAHVTDTYWYLHATPTLMARIADAGEALGRSPIPACFRWQKWPHINRYAAISPPRQTEMVLASDITILSRNLLTLSLNQKIQK